MLRPGGGRGIRGGGGKSVDAGTMPENRARQLSSRDRGNSQDRGRLTIFNVSPGRWSRWVLPPHPVHPDTRWSVRQYRGNERNFLSAFFELSLCASLALNALLADSERVRPLREGQRNRGAPQPLMSSINSIQFNLIN